MTAAMLCDRCRGGIQAGAGEYICTGELLCHNCLTAHQDAEATLHLDARATAFLASRGRKGSPNTLRSLGVLLVVAGLVGSCAIFYCWPLGAYYQEVISSSMGLKIIKVFALVLPWLVILLPAWMGCSACRWLFAAARSLREVP